MHKAFNLRATGRQRAFTLIELLVVILIIAILIAVAAPSFLGQQDKAHDSAVGQNLAVLYKAAKAEAVDNEAGQGKFQPREVLLGALRQSEPQLAGKLEDGEDFDDEGAVDRYRVCSDSTADTLRIVAGSKSSHSFLMEATTAGAYKVARGSCAAGFSGNAEVADGDDAEPAAAELAWMNYDLDRWQSNADGSDRLAIAGDYATGFGVQARVADDGRIWYPTSSTITGEIVSTKFDGTDRQVERTNVCNTASSSIRGFALVPGSTDIVVACEGTVNPRRFEIRRVASDGSATRIFDGGPVFPATTELIVGDMLDVSPDGSTVVFVGWPTRWDGTTAQLYTVAATGTDNPANALPDSAPGRDILNPTYAPDGSIVYMTFDAEASFGDLRRRAANGTNSTLLGYQLPADTASRTRSFDVKRSNGDIVFIRNYAGYGTGNVAVMGLDGSDVRNVPDSDAPYTVLARR